MLTIVISALVLSIMCNIECTAEYGSIPVPGGWLIPYKVIATWRQASSQCASEGAVLASPLTRELRLAMQRANQDSNNQLSYFIGASTKFNDGQYKSIEGVSITNMPIGDMYQVLDSEHGDCLKMDGYNISVVSCMERLPFFCYKKDESSQTKCGTTDGEYELEQVTGSCYKVHREFRTWLEALSICVSEGGYLAIVNDAAEARIIANKIPDIRVPWAKNQQWEPLFVGLHDWSGNDNWRSIHGHTMDQVFNMWDAGQPSHDTPIAQLCGGLMRTGKLDNIWCDSFKAYFICEKKSLK